MPSIAYFDDNGSGGDSNQDSKPGSGHAPEPPARYSAGSKPPVLPGGPSSGAGQSQLDATRRLTTISKVLAFVSLLIGGIVLSTASLVIAVMAYRKSAACLKTSQRSAADWQSLKRSAVAAIVLAALALIANTAALVVVYPMVMQAIQTGEYGSLLAGAPQVQAPSTSGSSTWG